MKAKQASGKRQVAGDRWKSFLLAIYSLLPATRTKLVVELRDSTLSLALFQRERLLQFEKIFLRETSEEALAKKISSFTSPKRGQAEKSCLSPFAGRKHPETLLILPRSEVLQKELILQTNGRETLRESLETQLEALLPYSPKEMAFGLSLEPNGNETKGLLLALPEKHLREKLLLLQRVGLRPTEIITEDQALSWLLLERKEEGPFLLMDQDGERVLALFTEGGRLSFSRVFPKDGSPEPFSLKDIVSETSLALLEKGETPEKILLSGAWNKESEALILQHFNSPVERLGIPEGSPPSLYGARLLGKYPLTSLLPREEKRAKKLEEKRKLFRQTLASFPLFLGTLALAFSLHLQGMTGKIGKLEKRLLKLTPQAEEAKKIASSLETLSQAQDSKRKVLDLLKELSQKMPSSIKLRELRIEGKEFLFKGESPSHGFLSEAVGIFSSLPSVEQSKLGDTRLRKRLNEDHFEFEITGLWKN